MRALGFEPKKEDWHGPTVHGAGALMGLDFNVAPSAPAFLSSTCLLRIHIHEGCKRMLLQVSRLEGFESGMGYPTFRIIRT